MTGIPEVTLVSRTPPFPDKPPAGPHGRLLWGGTGTLTILPAVFCRCRELSLSSFSAYSRWCELVLAAPPAPPLSFSPLDADLCRGHQTSQLPFLWASTLPGPMGGPGRRERTVYLFPSSFPVGVARQNAGCPVNFEF